MKDQLEQECLIINKICQKLKIKIKRKPAYHTTPPDTGMMSERARKQSSEKLRSLSQDCRLMLLAQVCVPGVGEHCTAEHILSQQYLILNLGKGTQ